MWVPAKTPGDVIARLNVAVAAALREPEVMKRLEGLGLIPAGTAPEPLAEAMRSNTTQWAGIVKESGYTIEQ